MTVRPGRIAWSRPDALRGFLCALLLAAIAVGTVAAIVATRTSRWYVSSVGHRASSRSAAGSVCPT